jgi:NitT/TauT family transport system substrate-binding protein
VRGGGRTLLIVVLLACGLACQKPAGGPTTPPPPGGGAPGPATAAEPTRLRAIYSSPTGGHSMLWVAKEAGFFEQNGLDVELELLRGNQLVLAALMAGEIDLAQNTGTSVIDAALASQNIVALGTFTDRFTYKMMVDPAIRQPADLRGQSFASSSPGSTDEVAARKALAKLGIDPRDVDFISFQDQNGRVAAMRQGIARATIVVPPNDIVLGKAGFVELLDTADLNLPYVGIAPSVRPDFLSRNRATLERYMRAMIQGVAYYKQNPQFARAVIGKYMNLDDADSLEAAASYYARVMPRLPYITTEAVQAMIDDAAQQNPAVRDVDPNSLYDNSLIRAVEATGLIQELYRD